MLGSTRLVTDASGNPVRCIDYAPFGEEIPSGVNGRTGCYEALASPPYPAPSDVESLKFTGKERDAETGLDYFGARYFSGAQGRFTSPDAPFNDQHLEDPQSWNLYAYGRNNPLLYMDPTGGYVCSANTDCDAIEKARLAAQADANKLKDQYGAKSTQYKDAQRAIDALGAKGKDNGVTITAGAVGKNWGGSTDVGSNIGPITNDNKNGQNIQVTLDAGTVAAGGQALASTLAHEGSHVADGSEWVSSGFAAANDPTSFATEYRAYNVGVNLLGAAGVLPFSMGPAGGPRVLLAPGFPESMNGPQIEKLLAIPGGYGVTRQNPGAPAFYRHKVVRVH
jgi:RHS repeat-associated protein